MAGVVNEDEAVRCPLEKRAVSRFAFAQGCLGQLARGYIGNEAFEKKAFNPRIRDAATPFPDPPLVAAFVENPIFDRKRPLLLYGRLDFPHHA